ncbi:xpt [Symbiodinium pilosum]|uniref:Xpt protein n=1 Tax=Symbiodinium pilosum TaxID=2952 RepID=A0A812RZ34_SYMPI|nr:xpt [Symbiodinium pilosum]
MSLEVQSLALNALTKRIQDEAQVLPDGILRVADFLNYRVDPILMDSCGALLANRLSDAKPTKILAGCSSQGLLPAVATSRHLQSPVVFAYASVPNTWDSKATLSATIQGRAHWVLTSAISAEDRVVVIDDIVSTGTTIQALKTICEKAGAKVVGIGAIIRNHLLANGGADGDSSPIDGKFETLVQVSKSGTASVPVGITPAVQKQTLPEVVAADVLTERVLREGKVLPGNLLKVYSFINHQVDTRLMDMCGQLIGRVFAGFGIQKVLTAQTGGLPPAHAVATALRVPLVCARETHENDQVVFETMYSAPSESFTKKKKLVLYVTKESLLPGEVVLVVDDFLATGTTGVALHRLVEQAKAEVAGMAFLVEKRFQDGRGKILRELPHMNGRIVSLACIESMSTEGISLDCKVVGDCKPIQATDEKVMIDRVLASAHPSQTHHGGMINASTFLNHVVDTKLMDQAAALLAKRFVDARATAVLTAEMSGVAPALALAMQLRVPLVCARRELSKVMAVAGGTISAKVEGSTDSARGALHIFRDHLRKDDAVLLVDDILGNGATTLALQSLCDQAGATVVGAGFLVEKVFQHGRGKILSTRPHLADSIVALTKILSIDDQGLKVFRCPEPARDTWVRVATDLVHRMSKEVEIDVAANAMKFRSVLGQHMSMDPVLLDACGDVLAAQFAGVTKVLTGAPVQGLSVAYVVARHSEVPMIFARTGVPLTMKGQKILSAQAPTGTFNVSGEFFSPSDRVLIVDDFLASGQTALALKQICEESGAKVAGFAFLALNRTQLVGQRAGAAKATGRDALATLGGKVVVLADVVGVASGRCEVKIAEWLQRLS